MLIHWRKKALRNQKSSSQRVDDLQTAATKQDEGSTSTIDIHLGFNLMKRNTEHLRALGLVAEALKVSPSAMSTAGVKDKRAVTYQLCSVVLRCPVIQPPLSDSSTCKLFPGSRLDGSVIAAVAPTSGIHLPPEMWTRNAQIDISTVGNDPAISIAGNDAECQRRSHLCLQVQNYVDDAVKRLGQFTAPHNPTLQKYLKWLRLESAAQCEPISVSVDASTGSIPVPALMSLCWTGGDFDDDFIAVGNFRILTDSLKVRSKVQLLLRLSHLHYLRKSPIFIPLSSSHPSSSAFLLCCLHSLDNRLGITFT